MNLKSHSIVKRKSDFGTIPKSFEKANLENICDFTFLNN
jgi:hypothetical protein